MRKATLEEKSDRNEHRDTSHPGPRFPWRADGDESGGQRPVEEADAAEDDADRCEDGTVGPHRGFVVLDECPEKRDVLPDIVHAAVNGCDSVSHQANPQDSERRLRCIKVESETSL